MADNVNEWTFCTEHRKAVDGGSCPECNGDRNLVQVVRRYYLDVARNQVTAARGEALADAVRVLETVCEEVCRMEMVDQGSPSEEKRIRDAIHYGTIRAVQSVRNLAKGAETSPGSKA